MRVLLALFCLQYLFGVNGSSAQDTVSLKQFKYNRTLFLTVGGQISWFSVRDLETSPLIYHGTLLGTHLGIVYTDKKVAIGLDYRLDYGRLTTRNYSPADNNKAKAYNNVLDISVLRKINLSQSAWLYAGPRLMTLANIRINDKFENANVNYEGFGMLGPMFRWEKRLTWTTEPKNNSTTSNRKTIICSVSLFIPVINGITRPPYETIGDFVDGTDLKFHFNQIKVSSFNHFFSTVSDVSVSYQWNNRHALKFSYLWYYYNYYPSFNKVTGVQGNLSVSLLLALFKK